MEEDETDLSAAGDNADLATLIAGLEREIESLKTNLETQRLLNHAQRTQPVQALILQIDERQDQLELLQKIEKP